MKIHKPHTKTTSLSPKDKSAQVFPELILATELGRLVGKHLAGQGDRMHRVTQTSDSRAGNDEPDLSA
jgi:hypothetical protein